MTYFVTASDGTGIAYDSVGEGAPVVLIHGFGASRKITWANTNWYQTLERAGRKVIAIDCRGHGESDKPRAPADYAEERMATDIIAVLAALEIPETDLIGYSMGGQLALRLMHDARGRVRRAVIGGLGDNYFHMSKDSVETIAKGLAAKDAATITDPLAREFRLFCEKARDDLPAMAACMRRPRRNLAPEELRALPQKTLVVCGEDDAMAGSPERLAKSLGDAEMLIVPKRNHHSLVGDRHFKEAALAFLTS